MAFGRYPTGAVLAATLLTLYAIPFLLFVYRLDLFEREPATMVGAAFAWGGLVATSLALAGNQALFDLTAKLGSPELAGRWGPALAAPPIEETLKVLGVVVLVLIARDQFDTPLDGMVYGALVGLGFQVVENFIYCMNAIELAGGDREIVPVLGVFLVRSLIGLWSHATYTAIAGYGVGYFVTRTDRSLAARTGAVVLAFALAFAAHFVWNSPLLTEAFGEGFGILLGLVLKGIPVLVLLVVMYRLARDQEATWFREATAGEVGTDVLLPDELDELDDPLPAQGRPPDGATGPRPDRGPPGRPPAARATGSRPGLQPDRPGGRAGRRRGAADDPPAPRATGRGRRGPGRHGPGAPAGRLTAWRPPRPSSTSEPTIAAC